MTLSTAELSRRNYCGHFEAHVHDHSQVLVGLRGRLELEVEGRMAMVDTVCGLIVPAGALHTYDAPISAQLLVLDTATGRGLDRCRRFRPPPHWRTAPESLDAIQFIEQLLGAPRALERRAIRLDELDAAIDADLHAEWSTRRLAALCNLSAQRFHARFVELTGTTPMHHVRARRLAAAQLRLKAGWALETTALHVGHASASALAYALRRDLGVTSRALRRGESARIGARG
jgi:AraC-like DNA-binding protein